MAIATVYKARLGSQLMATHGPVVAVGEPNVGVTDATHGWLALVIDFPGVITVQTFNALLAPSVNVFVGDTLTDLRLYTSGSVVDSRHQQVIWFNEPGRTYWLNIQDPEITALHLSTIVDISINTQFFPPCPPPTIRIVSDPTAYTDLQRRQMSSSSSSNLYPPAQFKWVRIDSFEEARTLFRKQGDNGWIAYIKPFTVHSQHKYVVEAIALCGGGNHSDIASLLIIDEPNT